jgi:hypothetical protein
MPSDSTVYAILESHVIDTHSNLTCPHPVHPVNPVVPLFHAPVHVSFNPLKGLGLEIVVLRLLLSHRGRGIACIMPAGRKVSAM